MDAIHALAREHGLRVIEDAAHALPSTYRGTRIGSLSAFTCFSFYATKTLTTGEGGMVTTNDAAAANRIRLMRLHGIERDAWNRYREDGSWRYDVREAGFKYNFTDLQSALGLVQLAKCDALQESRRRIAEKYNAAFGDDDALELPPERDDRQSSRHLYVLRLRLDRLTVARDAFIERLREKHIACSVHFIPLHLHPFYRRAYGYSEGDFPAAEREHARCLSLPIFPAMSDDEIDTVIRGVTETVEAVRSRRPRVALASVHV
jgi:perosamine synthetase